MKLYTVGYRDVSSDKRLAPEIFYSSLPEDAVVVDIRSHPYSPFAPEYSYTGVPAAVEKWKPGVKTFIALKLLGNIRRDDKGKRISPPIFVDKDAGLTILEEILVEHESVVIFCACSLSSIDSETHRCHRFYVAEEMEQRIAGLEVVHLPIANVEV